MIRHFKAIEVFIKYEEDYGRLPTKNEFDMIFYNELKPESKHFYYVKRNYLKEKECEKNV